MIQVEKNHCASGNAANVHLKHGTRWNRYGKVEPKPKKKAEQTTGQGEIGSVTHNRDIPRPQPSTGGERQSKGEQCMGRLLIHICICIYVYM
jgi:hypothetical protein